MWKFILFAVGNIILKFFIALAFYIALCFILPDEKKNENHDGHDGHDKGPMVA